MPNIFDRAMFQAANKPTKAEEGITQGFDADEEVPEDEMLEEISQRKPNSPEILMNTLRGDMRSVDARYQELADMVGEDVAMETPPEILALLQAQLAAQQEGSMGIGALPPGQGVPPPPMPAGAPPMPTPQMGDGVPPSPQAPQGFAFGGEVVDPTYNTVAPNTTNSSPFGSINGYGVGYGTEQTGSGLGGSSNQAFPLEGQYGIVKMAQGGEVGNPSQGIAHFKGGGSVSPVAPTIQPVPQKTPEQIAAELEAKRQAEEAARIEAERQAAIKLQQERDAAYSTPTTTDSSGDIQPNAAFAPEVARRFMQSVGPGVQTGQSQRIAAKQYGGVSQYGTGMAPNYGFNPFAQQMQGRQAVPQYAGAGAYNFAQQPRQFNQGGIASLGNFSKGIADAGRNGDTVLAHITPEQNQYLTELGGGATINPQTGLPEHFMGMQALGNMGTALATRAAPYLQQANVLAGRALYNPTFTEPTLTQTRTTLGTFGPKVAEGMEMYYPTLTQGLANSRLGQMVATGAERLSQTPAWAKMGAAVMSIPGATYIADKLDNPNWVAGNKNAPVVPGDTQTGWVPPAEEDEKGGSSPINWNNVPVPPSGAVVPPATDGDKTNQVIQNAIGKKTRGERLDEYMAENVPIFEKYLGGDKSYDQAQALFLLADLGLKFASTRKPGESLVSSLARSASGIPGGLSALAANTEQARRQVKSAALTSGLQTLAAEDKAIADLQKEIIKKSIAAGEVIPTDLGGGLTSYRTKQGQPAGMRIDDTVSNSFLNSRFTPQATKDDKGMVTGFDTPYVRVSPQAQTINLDKSTRERLAGEVSRQEAALAAIDDAIKEYSGAFGAKAFFSNLKNNLLVPVSPLDPNVMTEQQRTKINMAINIATKAIAKTGDTGNIAVAEQKAAADILGDKPGTFFSDPDTALKRMMTVRTSLANQRLNTASQLGWLNQDVQLEVPNLGTATDPIPQDKMSYLKEMSKTFPNGQVYVNIGGKVTPVLLSTLKD